MEQSYVPCGFLVRSPGGPDVGVYIGSERPDKGCKYINVMI